jgi:hypothetical protein
MYGKIVGLLISIFLIYGGLSGTMVLRGTTSSTALVVVGFLSLAYNIYTIVVSPNNKNSETLVEPCNITLSRDSNSDDALKRYEYFLNGTKMGRLKNGGSLSITTKYKKNVIYCPEFPNNFSFEIQGTDPVQLHFKQFADKDGQRIEIVSGAVRTDL